MQLQNWLFNVVGREPPQEVLPVRLPTLECPNHEYCSGSILAEGSVSVRRPPAVGQCFYDWAAGVRSADRYCRRRDRETVRVPTQ